jgi:hypothetical protein
VSEEEEYVKARNSYRRGRLSTVDLLPGIGCFVKMEIYSFGIKAAVLN